MVAWCCNKKYDTCPPTDIDSPKLNVCVSTFKSANAEVSVEGANAVESRSVASMRTVRTSTASASQSEH